MAAVAAAMLGMGVQQQQAACSAEPTAAETPQAGEGYVDDAVKGIVGSGVYTANDPLEDRHVVKRLPQGEVLAAVFDGHGGWQAAEFAQRRLSSVVLKELNNAADGSVNQVKGALTRAFLRLEREYLYQVKSAFELGFGEVARVGCCAITAMVKDDTLYVANAGDCRAVLARRKNSGGGLEAVALSNDHNAREASEQEKLRAMHPNEEDIVRCKRPTSCYVKGKLQCTRTLGDAYLKYSEFNGPPEGPRSAGRHLPPPYTPPYITADPEIEVHPVDSTRDQFVVIASDGLWDYLSNEEVVDIVGSADNSSGQLDGACARLIQRVLEKAASRYQMTPEALKNIVPGSGRRSKHDDITCVILSLQGGPQTAARETKSVNVAQ